MPNAEKEGRFETISKVRKRLFVVSSGSYSDYSVHFACPDKKTAEAMALRLNGFAKSYSEYAVEELPLYERVEQVDPVLWYRVEVDNNGEEVRRWTHDSRPWDYEKEGGNTYSAPRTDGTVWAWAMSTRGYAVALKIARDKLAQKKAKKAGVT